MSLVMKMTGSDALYASATPGNMWVLPTLGASQTPGLLVNLAYPSAMKAVLDLGVVKPLLVQGQRGLTWEAEDVLHVVVL